MSRLFFIFLLLLPGTLFFICCKTKANPQPKKMWTETMAKFPGGTKAMNKFIRTNLKYPADWTEGTCYIHLQVKSDSTIGKIEVYKGIKECAQCDTEAVRLVSSFPKFQPATKNGMPVAAWLSLPIKFSK